MNRITASTQTPVHGTQLRSVGGVFCEDVHTGEAVLADSAEPRGVRPRSMARGLAERLWTKTEERTGTTYDG